MKICALRLSGNSLWTNNEHFICNHSEQGMQGDDYVNCDMGSLFINEFRKLTR